MQRRAPTLREEEANIGRPFADDDRVGVGETTAVDVDDEVPGCEPGERTVNAARELVVRRPRSDRFADGKLE